MTNTFANSPDVKEIFQCMDFYAKYPHIRLFSGKVVYELHEKVRAFLTKKFNSVEEKQTAHGNFIWNLNKYYSTPFQKEAVALINSNVKELTLSDADKLKYLNYLLSFKNYSRFYDSFFNKLAQVDFSSDAQNLQARHIFYKMKTLLDKKKKNKTEYLQIFSKFQPFLDNYANQSKRVSYKMLGEIAGVYFEAGRQHEYKAVSMKPLVELLQNTAALHENKMPQLFADEFSLTAASKPKIDKKAVISLMSAYCDFVAKHEKNHKPNWNFRHTVTSMFCDIVQNFDYSAADVKNLRKAIGTKYDPNITHTGLYEMGLVIQQAYNNAHPKGVSSRNKTVHPAYKAGHSRWD